MNANNAKNPNVSNGNKTGNNAGPKNNNAQMGN